MPGVAVLQRVLLPGPFYRDRRGDVNALGGSPDRPIDQTIRGLEAHSLRVSAGDERLKLGDRDWRETSDLQVGSFNRRRRFG